MPSPESTILQFVGVTLPLLLFVLQWISTNSSSGLENKKFAYPTIAVSVFLSFAAILAVGSLLQSAESRLISLAYICLIVALFAFDWFLYRLRDRFSPPELL